MIKKITPFMLTMILAVLSIGSKAQCTANLSIVSTSNPYEFIFLGYATGVSSQIAYGINVHGTNNWGVDSMSHTFPGNGTYWVSYWVLDSANTCTHADTQLVTINVPPAGNCDATLNITPTSNPYQFVFTGTSTGVSSQIAYGINVNGTNNQGVNSMTHTFPGNGIYWVSFWVYDSASNCIDADTQFVNINITNCQAGFVLWQDVNDPTVYYGTNTSSGNNLSYLWNFGDGNFSTQQYPSHTYATVGAYAVCLTITDTVGNCTSAFCDSVGVMKAGITEIHIIDPSTVGITETTVDYSVSVSPNPLAENSIVNIQSVNSGRIRMAVYNIRGQLISDQFVSVNEGNNQVGLNTSTLAPGVYILSVEENGRPVSNVRLVK